MTDIYERSYDSAPSMAVVDAVADATDRSPLDLDPLAAWTDPEALDSLVDAPPETAADTTISFEYAGWQVTVDPGTLQIEALGDDGNN